MFHILQNCSKFRLKEILISHFYQFSVKIKLLYVSRLKSSLHLRQSIQEWTKLNLRKAAFIKFEGVSRPYSFKFFKGCLPQILLGPFLNTLSHLYLSCSKTFHFEWSLFVA